MAFADGRVSDFPPAGERLLAKVKPRFYAPWCGHCKNLKPAYEKAAKGVKGLAQVAAVNCDDESNKAFCGSMGVQGFPTLKIVKPSKRPGKPIVEDYQGPREARPIIEAIKNAIPNHVKRIADKGLNAWLEASNDTSKAILFSEKGTTGALIKVLAAGYLDRMSITQIRSKEKVAVEMFGITEYPTLVVLPGGNKEPVKFEGSFTKDSMTEFFDQYAAPMADSSAKKQKQKPLAKEPKEKAEKEPAKPASASSSFSEASSSHASAEASSAAGATSVTLEDESNPIESPEPIAVPEDAPKPAVMPDLAPPIPALVEQRYLEQQCLGLKTGTCILALLPSAIDEEGSVLPDSADTALASLAQLAEKHKERGGKLFPFYSIPARNTGAGALRDALKLGSDQEVELIAVNARRGWWRRFGAGDYRINSVETWVDAIRLGEGAKSKLPESLVVDGDKAAEEQPVVSEKEKPVHGEL